MIRLITLAGLAILGIAAGAAAAAEDLAAREERAFLAAAERAAASVVSIDTVGGLERVGQVLIGSGSTSGVIVSSDGFIVSSAFGFVQQPSSILVSLPNGTRVPARLVATDHNRMLVLLKVQVDEPLRVPDAVPLGEVQVGAWAVAVGRTFDHNRPNVSVGIVSARDRIWGKAIQTDAKISPVNYGGALADVRGRVLGVLVPLAPDRTGDLAGVEWYDSGIGFAVPLIDVLGLLPRLKEGKDLYPGLVGVRFKGDDMYADPPVLASVRPNSPAAKAGLKADDEILEVAGEAVQRRVEVTREIQRRYAGDTLPVAVLRGTERVDVDVVLAEKLDPYRRPFLGVLAVREPPGDESDAGSAGVTVRYVYPDSPADKAGIKTGDRLMKINGQPIQNRDGLLAQVAALAVGKQVELELRRGGEALPVGVELGTEPTTVPKQLPPARTTLAEFSGIRPPTGVFELKSPDFPNDCVVYVPERYDPRVAYGVVVWLHGAGGFDNDKLVRRWKDLCARDDLILVAPKSADPARWTAAEAPFVAEMLRRVGDDYHTDPARVVAHGFQTGGSLALLVAVQQRQRVRGVAAVHALLAGPLPENDPDARLDFYVVTGEGTKAAQAVEPLRQRLFTVVLSQQKPPARYLNDDELGELLRWIDSLDKI